MDAAKSIMLIILNQSASTPNNHEGLALKSIRRKVAMKITLDQVKIITNLSDAKAKGWPPSHLPKVSSTLKVKIKRRAFQAPLTPGSSIMLVRNLKLVPRETPGKIMNVIVKTMVRVTRKIQATIKLFFIINRKATKGEWTGYEILGI